MKQQQECARDTRPPTSVKENGRSTRPGAVRMMRLRDRRQRGFRVYCLEVSAADIDTLIARGFLDRLDRGNSAKVEGAIGAVLDRLGE